MEKDVIAYNKMKKGSYEIHVLIEATSGLSLDRQGDIDVMISLSAFESTQYSKTKSDVGYQQTFWGEHFFFQKNFDLQNVVEGQRLLISVWDHNRVLRNSLVGNYQLDIQRIYSQKKHCFNHIWLSLSNIEKDFSEITGYVKISVSVIGEGDQNIELEVEPLASITKQKKVLMPPNIERKSYQLIMDIYSGRNIKPADGKTVDSYIGVEFGQIYEKTQPIMKNCNPDYAMRVYLPLALPTVVDNIAIRINDFNYISKTQVVGSHYININKLIAESKQDKKNLKVQRYTDLRWINFYGPQLGDGKDEQKNIYQFFPQLATYYVGSVLMQASINQVDKPVRRNEYIGKKAPVSSVNWWKVTVLITGALNLYNRNKRYSICVRIGAQSIATEQKECDNGFCLWLVRKSMSFSVFENQDLPDIFVYLVDHKGQKVCYCRFPAKQGVVLEDKWVNLKPDLAKVSFQNEQAGYLKVGIQLQKAVKKEEPMTMPIQSTLSKVANSNKKSGRVIVELISAQSLIPLDEDGSVDPFFTFSYLRSEASSTHKEDNLNPIFFQKIILQTDVVDQQGCPPIIVNAFDQDTISREFIGTSFIDVGDGIKNGSVVYGFNKRPIPYWYELKQNNVVSGRFLISIILLQNNSSSITKTIDIPHKKYNISLFILGLRGLKTNGLLSVKKPFVQFDYQNLSLYGQHTQNIKSKNVVTQPKQSGPSVNIKCVNKTVMILPQNSAYWPSLSARAKDYVLGGIYEPILGYFSINLRECLKRSNYARQQLALNTKIIKNRDPLQNCSARLQKIDQKVVLNLRNFLIKCLNYKWPIMHKNLALNKCHKINKKINNDTIVVLPCYKEISKGQFRQQYKDIILANNEYMRIGYDTKEQRSSKQQQKRNKHYRYYLNEPYQKYYERVNGIKMGIYDEIQIRKGRIFPAKDIASNLVRQVSTEDAYTGLYKGNCLVTEFKQHPNDDDLKFQEGCKKVLKNFMTNIKMWMFLYVIEGAELPPRDTFSASDPYLVIKLGSKSIDLSERYHSDTSNPRFNEKIKILLQFPENSSIDIEVWDHDPLKIDELIGTAVVDIENKIFAQLGTVATNSPIQTYNLSAKQSKMSQGIIRFWIDLVPLDEISLYRQIDIGGKNQGEYELRVIVWGCTEMPNNDIEDMNDLFITGTFNDETQQTDVHYRTSTGDGTFNWRMVYPMKLPITNPTLTFKVYDKDLLTFDDFISSGTFSIGNYLDQAFQTDSGFKLYLGLEDLAQFSSTTYSSSKKIDGQMRYDRFQVEMVNKIEDKNKSQLVGKIQISIQILTKEQALKKPVGKGRSQPNQHPNLPQPRDRLQFSWNPITMMTRLCGKRFRYKILCIVICLIVILLFYNFGHSFLGGLLSNAIN